MKKRCRHKLKLFVGVQPSDPVEHLQYWCLTCGALGQRTKFKQKNYMCWLSPKEMWQKG